MARTNTYVNYRDTTLMYALKNNPAQAARHRRWTAIAETWLAVEADEETRKYVQELADHTRMMTEYYEEQMLEAEAEKAWRDMQADYAAENWAESRP